MLGSTELHRLTDYAIALQSVGDYEDVARLTLGVLSDVIPCDWPSVALVSTSALPQIVHMHSPVAPLPSIVEADFALRDEDPIYADKLRLHSKTPATLRQYMSDSELKKTRIYNEVVRPQGVKRLLGFVSPGALRFNLRAHRERGADFNDDHRLVMHLITRHLEAATERLIARNGGEIPVGGKKFPVQRSGWLVCEPRDGKVLRSSSLDADRWMRLCTGADAGSKSVPREWLEEYQRRMRGEPAQTFSYRVMHRHITAHVAPIRPESTLFSVFFIEHPTPPDPLRPLKRLGLTRREAEVMNQVIAGKTNAQVGVELGITELTTKKHLENIFHKLGVANRTAAVARANEALRSSAI